MVVESKTSAIAGSAGSPLAGCSTKTGILGKIKFSCSHKMCLIRVTFELKKVSLSEPAHEQVGKAAVARA